jgi:hypothetical protein
LGDTGTEFQHLLDSHTVFTYYLRLLSTNLLYYQMILIPAYDHRLSENMVNCPFSMIFPKIFIDVKLELGIDFIVGIQGL